jgi:hypothetical protein
MNFREAEGRYFRLHRQFENGQLNSQEFEDLVSALQVQDRRGHWWSIGVKSGEWYVYRGGQWQLATPPLDEPVDAAVSASGRKGGGLARGCLLGTLGTAFIALVGLAIAAFFLIGDRGIPWRGWRPWASTSTPSLKALVPSPVVGPTTVSTMARPVQPPLVPTHPAQPARGVEMETYRWAEAGVSFAYPISWTPRVQEHQMVFEAPQGNARLAVEAKAIAPGTSAVDTMEESLSSLEEQLATPLEIKTIRWPHSRADDAMLSAIAWYDGEGTHHWGFLLEMIQGSGSYSVHLSGDETASAPMFSEVMEDISASFEVEATVHIPPSPTFSPTVLPQAMAYYTSEQLGITLAYPEGWQLAEEDESVFVSPSAEGLDAGTLQHPLFVIGVFREEELDGAATSQEIIEMWLDELPEDADVDRGGQLTALGQQWDTVSARFVDSGSDIDLFSHMGVAIWHEEIAYIFLAVAPFDRWDAYENLFQQILLSSQLSGPADVPTASPLPTATPAPSPTPAPTPTVTPIPVGDLLLLEDFEDPSTSRFDARDDERRRNYFEDGEYHMLVKEAHNAAAFGILTDYSDFVLEADARFADGPEEWTYGFMLRYQDGSNTYRYLVSHDGKYTLGKLVDGNWTTLIDWTETAHIAGGTDTNHLRVVCRGSEITTYVNGHYLGTAADNSFSAGKPGVYVGALSEPNVHVAFDNLMVWSIP